MKNKLIVLIVLIISASTCLAKEVLKSKFSNDIVVNGCAADWKDQTIYANSDLKIMFSISHDNENLYLLIKTMDRIAQQNIRKFGLECWISTKGKKKKNVGFVFPYLTQHAAAPFQILPDSPTELKREDVSLLTYEKQDGRVKQTEISLKGFKGLKDSVYCVENTNIEAVIKNEKATLVLEFKIPFNNLRPISAADIMAIGVGIKESNIQSQTTNINGKFDSQSMSSKSSLNDDTLMPTDQRINNDMPHQDNEKLRTHSFWFFANLSN